MNPLVVALLTGALLVSQAHAQEPVDTALVVAIDSSNSIETETFNLQFRATLEALDSPSVRRAVQSGRIGCIAAAIVTWSGRRQQSVVADWTRICTDADMAAFTGGVRRASYASLHHRGSRTSLAGALDFSIVMLENCPFPTERRVIDVSGNGVESPPTAGFPQLTRYRNEADARDIVINGLPMLTPTSDGGLSEFYDRYVITPTGFTIVATSPAHFQKAIERKFWLEIAAPWMLEGRSPPRRVGAPPSPQRG